MSVPNYTADHPSVVEILKKLNPMVELDYKSKDEHIQK